MYNIYTARYSQFNMYEKQCAMHTLHDCFVNNNNNNNNNNNTLI